MTFNRLTFTFIVGALATFGMAQAAFAAQAGSGSGLAGDYLSALHAERMADNDKAVNFYNKALAVDPENTNLLRQSYFLAAQAGDIPAAIAMAEKAVDQPPRRALASLIVGLGHYQKREYDKAWTYLEAIPTQQGQTAFAMPMLRAWGVAPLKPADVALAELQKLQGNNNASDLYNIMAGLLNEFYGRKEQALANYEALAPKIEQQPLSVLRLVAGGYHRLGKSAQFKDILAKYRQAHGSSPLTDSYLDAFADPQKVPRTVTAAEGMAESLFAMAQVLVQSAPNASGVSASLPYTYLALYLNPDLAIARRVIGMNLSSRGNYEESNAILGTISKTEPGYVAVQMQVAENLQQLGRSSDALVKLQEVAREQTAWPDVYIAMGDLYRGDKKYDAAVTAYGQALERYPANKADSWGVYYARGISYERAKNWDKAEQDFKKALQLNPEDAGLLNYLGYLWLDRGVNMPQARDLIQKAFDKRPEDGYIIDSLGWAMFKMGDYQSAVTNLEKAVQANPSDATINEHLGDAYWKVTRYNEARFQWRRALTLELDDDSQRTAIKAKLEQGLAKN